MPPVKSVKASRPTSFAKEYVSLISREWFESDSQEYSEYCGFGLRKCYRVSAYYGAAVEWSPVLNQENFSRLCNNKEEST